jgi:hypothetical protein
VSEYDGETYPGKRLLQCQICGKACLALSSHDSKIVKWLKKKDDTPRRNCV